MPQDRIRSVTANHYQLQGLRLIPLGIYLLAVAVSAADWLSRLPVPHSQPRWLGLAFCLALLTAASATAYYRCRYGSVAQFGRTWRNWLIAAAIIAFLGCAQLDQRLRAPIALAPL
jgi:hypothetical protein